MDLKQFQHSKYKGKIEDLVKTAMRLRSETVVGDALSIDEVAQSKFQVDFDTVLSDLGIDPAIDSVSAIFTLPDSDVKWIIPEIIRKAIKVGMSDAPIWPNVVAMEENTNQLKVTMPYINMSDATPHKVGESETIPAGTISYGQKTVEVFKIGRGIKIPYEVLQFVSINVVSIFMNDFGIKLGQAMDSLAIYTLLNGDQADGSESAAVIGTTTIGSKVYKDFLRPWVRGSRMGRNFNVIIGGESSALETLDLAEFKARKSGTTDAKLDLKTPVPNSASYFVHGNVPDDQEILLDKRFALAKYNVIPLNIESEKIVSNQTLAFYATITTGFAKLFLDGSLVLDKTVAFSTNGFPNYMDVDDMQNVLLGE